MDYKEKVLLLGKYRDALKMVKYYQEEIEQYRATKEQAKSQRITDMPISHGNQSDLSDYIVKLEEMQGKIYSKLIEAERLKTNIMVWCESLDKVNERLVIQYHYLQGHNLGWIADEMHYSRRTVERIRDKAIINLPEPDFNNLWL